MSEWKTFVVPVCLIDVHSEIISKVAQRKILLFVIMNSTNNISDLKYTAKIGCLYIKNPHWFKFLDIETFERANPNVTLLFLQN